MIVNKKRLFVPQEKGEGQNMLNSGVSLFRQFLEAKASKGIHVQPRLY